MRQHYKTERSTFWLDLALAIVLGLALAALALHFFGVLLP
jgi:hypothetical protein